MASLGSHVNVWETCLQLLERRGYSLQVWFDEDDLPSSWVAEKGEFEFVADNPIELLGLVAIYDDVKPDQHEPYWWQEKTDQNISVYDRVTDQAIAWEEEQMRWRERPDWAQRVRRAWEETGGNAEETAEQLRIPLRIALRLLDDMELRTSVT